MDCEADVNGSRTASEPILTGTLGQSDEHGLFLFKAMGGSDHALASSRLPQQCFYRVPWNIFPMGNTVPHILKLFSLCSCFLFPIAELTLAGSAPSLSAQGCLSYMWQCQGGARGPSPPHSPADSHSSTVLGNHCSEPRPSLCPTAIYQSVGHFLYLFNVLASGSPSCALPWVFAAF